MRKLREVLRLHFENKLSGRAIAKSIGVSSSTVMEYLARVREAGLTWPLPAELDSDEALTRLLFPRCNEVSRSSRPEPDWAAVHLELKRKHVTKQLLWEEYKAHHPDGYQQSYFCEHYAKWAAKLQLSMRQEHPRR